jgi:hypothetical protein
MVARESRVQRNCCKSMGCSCEGMSSLDTWQEKVIVFRRVTRGWAANVVDENNRQKQSLLAEYNCLDMVSEDRILDDAERTRMKELVREIEKIWVIEEITAR